MFMDFISTHVYIFLIIIFKVSTAIGSYYVSETSSTWTGKGSICSVAEPTIHHTSAGTTVETEGTSIDKEGVWVGYSEALLAFDYIGCLKLAAVLSYELFQSLTSTIGSPGQCFSVCSYEDLIGISNSECFCLKEDHALKSLQSNYTKCNTECDHQPGVACGGRTENGTRYISLYRLNTEVLKHTNYNETEMSCLQLEPTEKKFMWQNCSAYLLTVCDFNGTYVPISSPGQYGPWLVNANTCFYHGGFPMHYQNYNVTETKSQLWTNVIRSSVIKSEKQSIEQKALGGVRMRHGYIRKQENYFVVDFAENKSARKRVLCNNDQGESKSTHISIPIGVSSAVVLMVASVMIVFVILKRREKIVALCRCQKVTKSSEYDQPDNPLPNLSGRIETDNHAYECIDEIVHQKDTNQNDANNTSDSNSTHTYFVLEKPEKESTDSTGDNTTSSEENSSGKGINVYNKLNSEQAYDHVFKAKQNVLNTCNTTYNTTEMTAVRPDISAEKQADSNSKADEDELSHTDSMSLNS